MDNQARAKGMSYIEVIAVVGIIAVLAGVTMVRMNLIKAEEELEMSTNLVQSALTEASNKSLAPQGTETSPIFGYGVYFDKINQRIVLFKDIRDGGEKTYNTDGSEDIRNIVQNITNSNISFPTRVRISNLKKGVTEVNELTVIFAVPPKFPGGREFYFNTENCKDSGNSAEVTLEHVSGSKTKTITTECYSGNIKIN